MQVQICANLLICDSLHQAMFIANMNRKNAESEMLQFNKIAWEQEEEVVYRAPVVPHIALVLKIPSPKR